MDSVQEALTSRSSIGHKTGVICILQNDSTSSSSQTVAKVFMNLQGLCHGCHHSVEDGNLQWVPLVRSNLQWDHPCTPGLGAYCGTKARISAPDGVYKHLGGMIVMEAKVDQLVVYTAICIG